MPWIRANVGAMTACSRASQLSVCVVVVMVIESPLGRLRLPDRRAGATSTPCLWFARFARSRLLLTERGAVVDLGLLQAARVVDVDRLDLAELLDAPGTGLAVAVA